VQLRFNTAPIYPAPNVQCTMRLLRMDGEQSAKPMEEVGYTPEMVAQIEEMLVGSTGLVLLVGPTNSGKSTSLQSFINRIYARRGADIKVVTIEDPVEYILERACQMGVPRGKQTTDQIAAIYKTLLGSTLRQDPDVALVGEIRTNEQAEPVKDMVLAGRKILSTLHAYEAMAAFPRLAEIGVPPSLLTREGFVSGVIYQRLVPVLCPHCSESLTPEMVDSGRIRQSTYDRVAGAAEFGPGGKHDVRLRSITGCKDCNFTGITGRTPCAELLLPDATFLRHIRNGDELSAKNYWHRTGINTDGAGVRAIAHAIAKMRRGLVDPNDIEVQIGPIEIDRPEAPDPTPQGFGTGRYSSAAGGYEDAELLGLGGRNSAFSQSSFAGLDARLR
jgi:general secretion pathway protein E